MAAADPRLAEREARELRDLLLLLLKKPPDRVRAIEPRLVGVEDAAMALAISVREIKELVRRRAICSVKIGSRRLIPVEALDDYVNALREEGGL